MFDITAQAVADTASIHLKAADGTHLYDAKQQPVRIVVYGPGSAAFASVEARQTQRALRRMQDNDGKVTIASPDERRRETAEDLAAVTVRFENFDYPPAKGKEGAELFQALYEDRALGFIVEQVSKFVGNWSAFKPSSATG
jgi:hypothetical protein